MSSSSYRCCRRRSSSRFDAAASRTSRLVSTEPSVAHDRSCNRLAELVAPLVGMARRLPVAEPVVPARDVAAAAGEEQALRARPIALDGRAQRPGEIRVPEQRVPTDQRRMTGEAGHDRERRAVRPVDREHADRRVHGALGHDAVDGDSRRGAGAGPDPRGLPRAPGGIDDSRDRVRQELDVASEGWSVLEPDDAAAAREARGAVVVGRVDEHRFRRDPRQRLHALAHRGRQVGTGEDEVDRHDRDRRRAVVEHERLRRIGSWIPSARPVRAAQQPCGSPDGGVMSARATPALRLLTSASSLCS